MTIDQLRYFLAAAKYLNFSRAAEALYVHPTTLSRCINSMEQELGSPLFVRLKYSLQLTGTGRELRSGAEELVAQFDALMAKIKSTAEGITGQISLLAPQLYYQMLADPYAHFHKAHPQVELSVDVCPYSKMDTVCQAVLDDTVDLGLTFSQNYHDDQNELNSIKVYSEDQILAVPLDHPLASQESVKMSDLHDTTIILADHAGKETLHAITSVVDMDSNSVRIMHTSSGEALLLQFTAGMGVTLMPGLVGHNSGGNFRCLPITDFDTSFDVMLVWKKEAANPAIVPFVECVKKYCNGLHPVKSYQ